MTVTATGVPPGLLDSGLVELVLDVVGDRRRGGGDPGLVLPPGLLLAVAAFAGAGVEGLQLGGAVGASRGLAHLAQGAGRRGACGGRPANRTHAVVASSARRGGWVRRVRAGCGVSELVGRASVGLALAVGAASAALS